MATKPAARQPTRSLVAGVRGTPLLRPDGSKSTSLPRPSALKHGFAPAPWSILASGISPAAAARKLHLATCRARLGGPRSCRDHAADHEPANGPCVRSCGANPIGAFPAGAGPPLAVP